MISLQRYYFGHLITHKHVSFSTLFLFNYKVLGGISVHPPIPMHSQKTAPLYSFFLTLPPHAGNTFLPLSTIFTLIYWHFICTISDSGLRQESIRAALDLGPKNQLGATMECSPSHSGV